MGRARAGCRWGHPPKLCYQPWLLSLLLGGAWPWAGQPLHFPLGISSRAQAPKHLPKATTIILA